MALTSVGRGFKRRLWIGRTRQSSYGTASALSSNTLKADVLPSAPTRQKTATMLDNEMATGTDFPQKQIPLEITTSAKWDFWASPEMIGFWMAAIMGDDSVSTTGTSNYLHTITMVAAGTYTGAFTVEEHTDGDTGNSSRDKLWSDLTPTKVTITWGRTGLARMSVECMGSGRASSCVNPTETATINVWLPVNKIRFWVAPASALGTSAWGGSYTAPSSAGTFANASNITGEVDFSQNIESATFIYEQTLAADRVAGSSSGAGIYGEQPEVVRRSARLEVKWLTDNSTDDFLYALPGSTESAQAEYTVFLEFVTDKLVNNRYYGGAIIMPLVGLTDSPDGDATLDLMQDSLTFFAKKTYAGTSRDPVHVYTVDGQNVTYNN